MSRILIVDDQKSVLLTLESLLVKDHHVVTACTNAIDALANLTKEPFDLMITDAIMPIGGNGYALIKTVRNHPQLAKLPVILLTGKREKADVEKGIEAGADDYVVKPIDPELLLAKIKNLLSSSAKNSTQFAEAHTQIKAEWETRTEIIAVSELGFVIQTNIPVPVGLLIKVNTPLFDEIGIPKVMLRIANCEALKAPEHFYRVQTHFVGLSEKELTPLRLWIRTKKSY